MRDDALINLQGDNHGKIKRNTASNRAMQSHTAAT